MLENRKSVDQKVAKIRQRVMDLIAANAELFAQQGAVVESWRKHGGRRLGPYFRLAYRIDGRRRSLSLRKTTPTGSIRNCAPGKACGFRCRYWTGDPSEVVDMLMLGGRLFAVA